MHVKLRSKTKQSRDRREQRGVGENLRDYFMCEIPYRQIIRYSTIACHIHRLTIRPRTHTLHGGTDFNIQNGDASHTLSHTGPDILAQSHAKDIFNDLGEFLYHASSLNRSIDMITSPFLEREGTPHM